MIIIYVLPLFLLTSTLAFLEEKIIYLTNLERQKRGLSWLEKDEYLREAAFSHSKEMAELNYFSHFSPKKENREPADRVRHTKSTCTTVAENIYKVTGLQDLQKLPAMCVESWMNSPHHRENILTPYYNRIGVGIYKKGDTYYVTQLFAEKFMEFRKIKVREIIKEVYEIVISLITKRKCEIGLWIDGEFKEKYTSRKKLILKYDFDRNTGKHLIEIGYRKAGEKGNFLITNKVTINTDTTKNEVIKKVEKLAEYVKVETVTSILKKVKKVALTFKGEKIKDFKEIGIFLDDKLIKQIKCSDKDLNFEVEIEKDGKKKEIGIGIFKPAENKFKITDKIFIDTSKEGEDIFLW